MPCNVCGRTSDCHLRGNDRLWACGGACPSAYPSWSPESRGIRGLKTPIQEMATGRTMLWLIGRPRPDNIARRCRMQVRQIDLAGSQSQFVAWLQKKMPEATDISVANIERSGSGLSNETFLFDLTWKEGGNPQSRGMVLRLPPKSFPVHPRVRPEQAVHRNADTGEKTNVPVPKVYWMEEDAERIGGALLRHGQAQGRRTARLPSLSLLWQCTSMPRHRSGRRYGGAVSMPWPMSTSWTGRSWDSLSSGHPAAAPIRWIVDWTTWR